MVVVVCSIGMAMVVMVVSVVVVAGSAIDVVVEFS